MTLTRRVQAVRARARIQRWEFRQRNLAHGAWGRFRMALAHAERAFALDAPTADALISEGHAPDPAGAGLEPSRIIVWISDERALALTGARPLAMRLDGEMLAARYLALVPFRPLRRSAG